MSKPLPKPTLQESATQWEAYAHGLEQKIAALEAPATAAPRWFENAKVIGIISEVSLFLTILASLSYNLGPAADLLSPKVKTVISSVGVFATLVLQLLKRYLEPKPVINPPKL